MKRGGRGGGGGVSERGVRDATPLKSNGHYRRGVAVQADGHRAAAASSAAGQMKHHQIVTSRPVVFSHVPRRAI